MNTLKNKVQLIGNLGLLL